jgi:type II secretion system protein G
MKKSKQGFTLIELLVVVAIIGLLATLSIVALNNARARARDARRVADIKQIQTALELYYNDQGSYPTANIISAGTVATNSIVYMGTVPTAPTPFDNTSGTACNATNNLYTYTGTAQTYSLTYCLGSATGGIAAGVGTATPSGIK